MDKQIKVIAIDKKSSYLPMVIDLANANSATLGFFPRGAFVEHAGREQILVAADELKNFLGYLLYSVARTKMEASIVHLCIDPLYRNQGIAKTLTDHLKNITKAYRGIRLHCRIEYDANNLWPKLGFEAQTQMSGRSKSGSTLIRWWFDHGHPSLFKFADEQRIQTKLKAAIDANVFYDLQDEITSKTEESKSLLADWLQDDLVLCVTSELFNEIIRHPDQIERKRRRDFAHEFPKLSGEDTQFQEISKQLRHLFPERMKISDRSDLRHLARAIAADAQFLVTRDQGLLDLAEQIYDDFKMQVMRPADLIIHLDELYREAQYQPGRLGGSSELKTKLVRPKQDGFLASIFSGNQETNANFLQRLRPLLANPHTFEICIVENVDEHPVALIVYGRQKEYELEIPIFRVTQGPLAATLARYLVLSAILTSSNENRILTKFTDPLLPNDLVDALQENGFVHNSNNWVKANLTLVETTETLSTQLASLGIDFPQQNTYFQDLFNTLNEATLKNDSQTLLNIERSLWPAKITDLDIPAYIVPIEPKWAMELFDKDLAEQTLFGPKPSLILNGENVYYSASRRKLDYPARILWYVSKGKGYQYTMSVRACSYIDEVVIDKPKRLFSRFRRLGVYEWKHVFERANKDIDKEIMAFTFKNTELFKHRIPINELHEIWQEQLGRNFYSPQQPVSISKELFFHLYKVGMQIQ